MALEEARDASISEDGVLLEPYEIQDSPLQECMMLAQHFRETSLDASETEKARFKNLLAKAQKEELNLKSTLRTLREEVRGLRVQNEGADEQISLLNSRLKKEKQNLVEATEESEEQIISLRNLLHEQRQKLEEFKNHSEAELQLLRDKLAQQRKVKRRSSNAEVNQTILNLQRQLKEAYQINCEISESRNDAWVQAAAKVKQMAEMGSRLDRIGRTEKKEKSVQVDSTRKMCALF